MRCAEQGRGCVVEYKSEEDAKNIACGIAPRDYLPFFTAHGEILVLIERGQNHRRVPELLPGRTKYSPAQLNNTYQAAVVSPCRLVLRLHPFQTLRRLPPSPPIAANKRRHPNPRPAMRRCAAAIARAVVDFLDDFLMGFFLSCFRLRPRPGCVSSCRVRGPPSPQSHPPASLELIG
jgi:hypothetical protein